MKDFHGKFGLLFIFFLRLLLITNNYQFFGAGESTKAFAIFADQQNVFFASGAC